MFSKTDVGVFLLDTPTSFLFLQKLNHIREYVIMVVKVCGNSRLR